MENSYNIYKMTKTVTQIDCPKGFNSDTDYSSHRPLLYLGLLNTEGDVIECGCGYGSTNLIDSWCLINGREFSSYENDSGWSGKFKLHKGTQVLFHKSYPTVPIKDKVGLLFVDSKPGEERKDIVNGYRDTADVIILHDTEEGAQNIYGIREVLDSFKYRLNYYPEGLPGTTALSNKINVCEWL